MARAATDRVEARFLLRNCTLELETGEPGMAVQAAQPPARCAALEPVASELLGAAPVDPAVVGDGRRMPAPVVERYQTGLAIAAEELHCGSPLAGSARLGN